MKSFYEEASMLNMTYLVGDSPIQYLYSARHTLQNCTDIEPKKATLPQPYGYQPIIIPIPLST